MDYHIGETAKGLIAGFCGAMVYSVLHRPKTWGAALGQMFGGVACSHYLAPWFAMYFSVTPEFQHAVSFLVGLFGLAIVGGALWAIEKYDFGVWLPSKKTGE